MSLSQYATKVAFFILDLLVLLLYCCQVEIKNLNSFSSISRAIDYEIARQAELHSQGLGDQIVQETRLWEEGAQVTTICFFLLFKRWNMGYLLTLMLYLICLL